MGRLVHTQTLSILILTSFKLMDVRKNCTSAKDLQERFEKVSGFNSMCLIDIDWEEVYNNIKEE